MTIDRLGSHFRRFGVTATWTPDDYTDGGSGTVIFDAPDEPVLGDAAQSTEYVVEYAVSAFVGMDNGDELVIGGVCYTVRNVRAVDDGQVMRATLTRVTS